MGGDYGTQSGCGSETGAPRKHRRAEQEARGAEERKGRQEKESSLAHKEKPDRKLGQLVFRMSRLHDFVVRSALFFAGGGSKSIFNSVVRPSVCTR